MDVNQYISAAEQYLLSLPRDYTPEMAMNNNDILYDRYARTYNLERLLDFINNVNNGITDYVTVTTYGMDGPAVTKVLQYNGDTIIYSYDGIRYPYENKVITYIGYKIDTRTQNMYGVTITSYDLIDVNNKPHNIIKNVLI